MSRRRPGPARRALRIPSSALPGNLEDSVPGMTVLRPGDPGYDTTYARAVTAWQELGIPLPYADG
ncbi:MAG: hypothetical protein NVSMB65_12930 [Chloroflexota bacterium]